MNIDWETLGPSMLGSLLAQHPLPWSVREGVFFEVYDADYNHVSAFDSREDALLLVQTAYTEGTSEDFLRSKEMVADLYAGLAQL